MAKGFADWSILQYTISIRSVIMYFGGVIEAGMCICPFHKDNNPSMIVNQETCYCFACGRQWNIYRYVAERLKISEDDAYAWLVEHQNDMPTVDGFVARKRGGYAGPVDPRIVNFWNSCLGKTERQSLYQKRLLTDDTIDQNLIGWHPEYKAYSIPFWSGVPQQSDITIVQFRLTDQSPSYVTKHTKDRKFIGISGHNKPCLINSHLLTKKWAVMLIGTFDALLGGQDGLPAVSPNGASAFAGKKWKEELNGYFTNVERVYIVYDATESERASVDNMAAHLDGKEIIKRGFTEDVGKDYGDFRYYGHCVGDFYRDILKWELC
jgi:hypothetical protein